MSYPTIFATIILTLDLSISLKYTYMFITKTLYHKHFILMDFQSMWMKTTVNRFEIAIKCVVESIECFWMNKFFYFYLYFSSFNRCVHASKVRYYKVFCFRQMHRKCRPSRTKQLNIDWSYACMHRRNGQSKTNTFRIIKVKRLTGSLQNFRRKWVQLSQIGNIFDSVCAEQ